MPTVTKKKANLKLANPTAASTVDPNVYEYGKPYTFVMTDDSQDRDGDVIELSAWKFDNFLAAGGPVLYHHDSKAMVVGKVISIETTDTDHRAVIQFAPTDEGRDLELLVAGDFIRSCSVGFMALDSAIIDGVNHITSADLVELSITPIPSNPRALKLKRKAITMSKEEIMAAVAEALAPVVEQLNALAARVDAYEMEKQNEAVKVEAEKAIREAVKKAFGV